jgi:ADP-ribose pyrophosphatase
MTKPWQVLSETILKAGVYRKVKDVLFRLPTGMEKTFTIKLEGRVGCVLALTKDKKVILARQFRPGPMEILDELPGGGFEPHESGLEGIQREFLEETGYKVGKIVSLGKVTRCAYSTVDKEIFVATGCEKVQEPELEEGEFVEVVLKSLPEFMDQLLAGRSTDLETAWAGMYYLGYLEKKF